MRFAQIAGLSALVYINLAESSFLLDYAGEKIYKKDLSEQEIHIVNGLINKDIYKRINKEGKIAYIRNHKIEESAIKPTMPLIEGHQPDQSAEDILYDFLKAKEAYGRGPNNDEAYDDGGVWSCGFGRRCVSGETTTKAHEEAWLRGRAREELDYVKKEFPGLNPYQQAAIGSIVYNVGRKGFRCKSGTNCTQTTNAWDALKAGDYKTFEYEAYDPTIGFVQDRVNGVHEVIPGLVNRRQAEQAQLWRHQLQISKLKQEKEKKELQLAKRKQEKEKQTAQLAKPKPTTDQNKNVPKYGTVEWYKTYGTDPNPAVDA